MSISTKIRMAAPAVGSALALALMFAVTSAPQAMALETIKQGEFVGENKHITTGTVTIQKDGDRTLVILGPKFSLDGAPDPRLGFSKNGQYDPTTTFTKLKSLNGIQVYELPKNITPAEYDKFVLWCEKFDVSLGSAILK